MESKGTTRLKRPSSKRNRDVAQRNLDRFNTMMDDIVKHPERYPPDAWYIPLHGGVAEQVLTRERIRLITHLRDHGPYERMRDLADALGRDIAAISRDVTYLEGSIVVTAKVGRRKTIRAKDIPIILI